VSATPGPWTVETQTRKRTTDGDCYAIISPPRGPSFDFIAPPSVSDEQHAANANLVAAAPDLLRSVTVGAEVNLPDLLEWLADRMVNVYGESPNVDFVLTCRDRANGVRAAIAKAEGK
jgi:hypothetical protein